jgi:Ammonium Transporter Family
MTWPKYSTRVQDGNGCDDPKTSQVWNGTFFHFQQSIFCVFAKFNPFYLLNSEEIMVIFEQCYEKHSDNLNQVIQCVSEWAETDSSSYNSNLVNVKEFHFWLYLICGALVFFMQTGFAMICAGAVRKKNMSNTYVSVF